MASNVERLDALYDGFWHRGDWHSGADVIAPDIEWHGIEDDPTLAGTRHGARGVNAFFSEWLEAWEAVDVDWEIQELGPHLLLVRCPFRVRGKSSGMEVATEIGQIWEFEDGKAIRQTMYRTYDEARQAATRISARSG